MEHSNDLLISLALILLSARLGAQVSTLLGFPSVLGMLTVGVLLGPGALHLVQASAELDGVAQVGVVLLLFVAGLETDVVEMRRVGRVAFLAAAGGVLLPLLCGIGLAVAFGYSSSEAVFLGTVLTATSVSVSVHVLRELGQLQSPVGNAILGAAVIDDILGIALLAVVTAVEDGGSSLTLVRLALFLPAAALAGRWIVDVTAVRLQMLADREGRFLVVFALVLAFAWAAEAVGGLAAISGAYLVGVLLGRTVLRDHLADFSTFIGYAFFAPVFFVTTGLAVDPGALAAAPLFAVALSLAALITKALGCFLGARVGGFSRKASVAVGAGMVARGEVALVIAALGRQTGHLDERAFAATIAMTLVTTLAAPILLRLTLPRLAHPAALDRRELVAAEIDRLES